MTLLDSESDERAEMIQTVLAVAVTIYGVAGALASVLQLRHMRRRGSSRDVSLGYLAVVAGGYVLWLAYGIAIRDLPLIFVDALGGAAIFATISVAVRLRGADILTESGVRLPGKAHTDGSERGHRRRQSVSPVVAGRAAAGDDPGRVGISRTTPGLGPTRARSSRGPPRTQGSRALGERGRGRGAA